jgi:hypothetical protein
MKTLATYSGWSIDDAGGTTSVWRIYDGYTYPLLRSFLTSATATYTKTYDGTTAVTNGSYTWSAGVDTGHIYSGTVAAGATGKNAGTHAMTVSGFYSDQQGYDISGTGSFIVTPKALTITGTAAANKSYDGTATATITAGTLSGLIGTETLAVTATGTFDSKNAGARTATAAYTLADGTNEGLAGNYSLANTAGLAATIAPKAVSAAYTGTNKTYDGTTAATVTGSLSGLIGTDTVTVSDASATFSDKNAGTGKTITVSGIALGGADAGNYTLAANTATTTANITKAALTATANNDLVAYSGVPYSGGNGVTYDGFVGSETSAVLGGSLLYGGSSQGAVNTGSYSINPSGLTSGNYDISFKQGDLAIGPNTGVYTGLVESSWSSGSDPAGVIARFGSSGAGSTTIEGLINTPLVN